MNCELLGLDKTAVLDRVGGDEELLREITDLFLVEYPEQLEEIRKAVAARDARQVQESAHSLKGAVSNFGAAAVTQAAFELEQMGRQNDLSRATSALAALEAQLASLQPALRSILQ